MGPLVDIVIVAWNCRGLVDDAVQAIKDAWSAGAGIGSVTIVDNGSVEGQVPRPPHEGSGPAISIIENPVNLGFAAACNLGAKCGVSEFVLFLNPDVVVTAEAIGAAVGVLVADGEHRVGAVGVQLLDQVGQRQLSVARFPSAARLFGLALGLDRVVPGLVKPHFLSADDHRPSGPVDQIMGAFWMMRRSDLETVGGWDERFFLYMEDVDLALRLAGRGQRCWYVATAAVRHAGMGTTRSIPSLRLFYLWRSRIIYARKHFGTLGRLAVVVATLAIEPVVRAAVAFFSAGPCGVAVVGRAVLLAWSTYPYRRAEDRGEVREGKR